MAVRRKTKSKVTSPVEAAFERGARTERAAAVMTLRTLASKKESMGKDYARRFARGGYKDASLVKISAENYSTARIIRIVADGLAMENHLGRNMEECPW